MNEYSLPNNSCDLSGQVALVTGTTSGLGWRFARVLASAGARVALTGRRTERLEELGEQQQRNAEIIEELAATAMTESSRREYFNEVVTLLTPTLAPWADSSKKTRVDAESWAREFFRKQAFRILFFVPIFFLLARRKTAFFSS